MVALDKRGDHQGRSVINVYILLSLSSLENLLSKSFSCYPKTTSSTAYNFIRIFYDHYSCGSFTTPSIVHLFLDRFLSCLP